MKSKIFFMLICILVFICLSPLVFAENLHSLDTFAVLISADDYKLQNVPVNIYSTSFGEYCELCEQDEICCQYCKAPSCEGIVMSSSSKGGIAQGALNLKFENDFQVSEGSNLCPSVSVKKSDICLYSGAIDSEKDRFWFTIDSVDYISEKYYLSESYELARDIFLIENSFNLSDEDRKAIKKCNGGSLFVKKAEDPCIKNGIIQYSDITSLKFGVVTLTEKARVALRERANTSKNAYIGLLIVIVVIGFVFYSNKKKK